MLADADAEKDAASHVEINLLESSGIFTYHLD